MISSVPWVLVDLMVQQTFRRGFRSVGRSAAGKLRLLDQIMFINVFRKSPRKQFTGELTDLQSFLTEVPA